MTKDKPKLNNPNEDLFESEKTDTIKSSPKSISSSILFNDHKKIVSSNGTRKIRNLSESNCLNTRKSSFSLEDDEIFLKRKSSIKNLIQSSNLQNKQQKNHQSSLRKFLFYLNNLRQFFKFSVIIIISILVNSLYFNFYYLPSLNHYNSIDNKNNQHESISNDQKAKISYMKSSFESYNEKVDINSYDHVAFASFDNYKSNNENNDFLSRSLLETFGITDESNKNKEQTEEKRRESQMALNLALTMYKEGKYEKAAKIYKYALSLDPNNYDALTSYGEYLENHKKDIIKAEHLYNKVIRMEPKHDKAALNLKRALPLVNKLDRKMLDKLDMLLKKFYEIPSTSAALKRAKKEAYFMHIYHSNAIEGNTLNLQQTRHIVENRMAINGKSLYEHQEVLGLDAAMRYINETLLYRRMEELTINDILEIHKRVLGYCDPIESGKFRQHQVYVGKFTPPSPQLVKPLMDEFIEWINSNQLLTEAHPVQIAALVHYKFVYIHPFYDGNGRTGRLLMNLILMKYGYPPVIIKKHQRLEYYEYLEMANQGDVRPFIRFISKCTKTTLEEYIRLCNDSHGITSDKSNFQLVDDSNDDPTFDYIDNETANELENLDENKIIITNNNN